MHRVLSIVAVQQCWATAELYGVQHLIVVNAVTNEAVLVWVAEQHWCRLHAQGPRHCCCESVLGYSRAVWGAHLTGVNAVTNKAVFSMGCRAALVQAACTGT